MTFVEFESSNYPKAGAKHYFVGRSLSDILADTNSGRKFGFAIFTSFREVSIETVEALQLGFFKEGVRAVERGCLSFKLGKPPA
ncbi:MAG: hypothetical protein Q7S10_03355 [bacterium]|nr:hypothetical protein [bacterium]